MRRAASANATRRIPLRSVFHRPTEHAPPATITRENRVFRSKVGFAPKIAQIFACYKSDHYIIISSFRPLLPTEKGHFPAFLRAWRMSGRCSRNQISGQFTGKRSKNDGSGPREGTATVLSTHKALYIPRSMASKRDMMREALTRCTQLSPASIAMQAAMAALSPSTMKTGSMRILP